MFDKDYLETLKNRKKETRVSQQFQHAGLVISGILEDSSHKALYIKLAKIIDSQKLIELAKDVADRQSVKNPGAYFMKMLKEKGLLSKLPKNAWTKNKKQSGQSKKKNKKLF